MKFSSVDPGVPNRRCPHCGNLTVPMTPSFFGDVTCAACGGLVWVRSRLSKSAKLAYKHLRDINAKISVDPFTRSLKIDLSNCRVNSSTFAMLLDLPAVVEIILNDTDANDDDVEAIAKLSTLQVLELGNTLITDRCLEKIQHLQQLEVLGFFETQISESSLHWLAPLRSLWCLDLERTSFSGDLILKLECLKRLEWLFLCGTRIDAAALRRLGSLKKLTRLWLDRSSIKRPRDLMNLRRNLPNCVISLSR